MANNNMRDNLTYSALTVFGLVLSVAASYGMAMAGEPRAYWLWHTVLGVLE